MSLSIFCKVAFVVAWSDDAGLNVYDENVWSRRLGAGAGMPVLPLREVFLAHMDLSGWVIRWASNASEARRDEVLALLRETNTLMGMKSLAITDAR